MSEVPLYRWAALMMRLRESNGEPGSGDTTPCVKSLRSSYTGLSFRSSYTGLSLQTSYTGLYPRTGCFLSWFPAASNKDRAILNP